VRLRPPRPADFGAINHEDWAQARQRYFLREQSAQDFRSH